MTTTAPWFPVDASLADGLSWTGAVDGRTWTVSGSGWTMPYPPSIRDILFDAWDAAVPDGVQVYVSPPETLAPPAVVIRPADPYQAPAVGGGHQGAAWAFECDIIMGRHTAAESLDALERAREQLTGALPSGWRWVEFGDIGEIVVNKKQYMRATLGVAVIVSEGMARYG